MNDRAALTHAILASKRRLGLSWATIATTLGAGSLVFYTAALLGHFALTPEEAKRATDLLELPADATPLLAAIPDRADPTPMPPTDPLLYRFYELVQNFGPTWKQLIQEEFGDGIMSAIDFNMALTRQPDPAGDRVHITMSGKFLPYKRF